MLAYSLEKILGKRYGVASFSHYELDITNKESYYLLNDYDIIVNTAAFKDVDKCDFESDTAFKVNGEAPGHLAEYCNKRDKMFVHFSTDYIFDGCKDGKYSEGERANPINIYGKSKLEGEKRIIEQTDKYLIIRVAWLFGRGKLNFVDRLIKNLVNDKTIELINDKWGNPTYTDSVSEALTKLLFAGASGIFHVVNEGCTTRYDMGIYIKKILGIKSGNIIPISKESVDSKAVRPMYTCLSCKKYTELTGTPMEYWRDVIRNYIDGVL